MLNKDNLYAKVNLNRSTTGHLDKVHTFGVNAELCVTDTTYLFESFDTIFGEIDGKLKETRLKKIIHLPFYGLQLGCVDSYIRELSANLLKQGIARGLELGIDKGVMHIALPLALPANGERRWLKTFYDRFDDILSYCRQRSFTLYLENTYERLETFAKIIEKYAGENLAVCLDIAHIHCFAQENFIDWWQVLAAKIAHIHLSDNNLDEDSHYPLGKGRIDFREIFSIIQADEAGNKKLTFTLENDIPAIPASLAYLKQAGLYY